MTDTRSLLTEAQHAELDQDVIYAIKSYDIDLLKKKLSVRPPLTTEHGKMCLHLAIEQDGSDVNATEIVKLLIAAGADVAALDKDNKMPIEKAAVRHRGAIVRIIAEKMLDNNKNNNIDSSLSRFLFNLIKEDELTPFYIVKMLLEVGIKIDWVCPETGNNVLHQAVKYKNSELLWIFLCSATYNQFIQDNHAHKTPFLLACITSGAEDCAEMLLDRIIERHLCADLLAQIDSAIVEAEKTGKIYLLKKLKGSLSALKIKRARFENHFVWSEAKMTVSNENVVLSNGLASLDAKLFAQFSREACSRAAPVLGNGLDTLDPEAFVQLSKRSLFTAASASAPSVEAPKDKKVIRSRISVLV